MATQIVQVVAITATSSLIIAGMLFYLLYRFTLSRRIKRDKLNSSFRREPETGVPRVEFQQHSTGAIKGLIVDEEGLDMLYVRKFEGGQQFSGCFSKVWYNPLDEEVKRMNDSREEKPNNMSNQPTQEIPLLQEPIRNEYEVEIKKPLSVKQNPLPPPPPPSVSEKGDLETTPKVKPAPPPLPAKKTGLIASNKPPIFPRGVENRESRTKELAEESMKGNGVQMKLKPLHWDKVTANADHSMVWNEINNGSFRFDDDLMETLFGYTTNTHKPTTDKSNKSSHHHANSNSLSSAQIFLLDPRKSQNTAIVLKSLPISRKEILDALLEGRGLNSDTLEKLTKICPTQDEITKILNYNDNPKKLADAESFLYHILKAVPSSFICFKAMLFRSTYVSEILYLKQSLQTLELGCTELRTCRIFFKLLEAILKAGNRLNAGTNRGNAQGFNLNALCRLSDVKSTDGKTTLLHFVVEQVVRSEGKRFLIDKDDDSEKNSDIILDIKNPKKEKDTEHVLLGLKVLESLNTDFVNVKKASEIDCDNLFSMCSILTRKVDEIKGMLKNCKDIESGGFLREMKGFLEDCEEELNVVRDEEKRVVEIMRKTTAYYQAKDKLGINCLQLFVIVKDFLNNVDQVCAEIGTKLKKEKVGTNCVAGSSPPLSPNLRSPVRFQNLELPGIGPAGTSSDSKFLESVTPAPVLGLDFQDPVPSGYPVGLVLGLGTRWTGYPVSKSVPIGFEIGSRNFRPVSTGYGTGSLFLDPVPIPKKLIGYPFLLTPRGYVALKAL
ncbi:formin-like protein 8 [Phtheirospermum japonicum]|uniref:Formin-like protein n=1 Tax=Phtheirospermum japonicum TaxID=374723 RepID=A0A830CAA3_9LAMI|nr:formin-like protein 8 [Phtheirospermum japonicum]